MCTRQFNCSFSFSFFFFFFFLFSFIIFVVKFNDLWLRFSVVLWDIDISVLCFTAITLATIYLGDAQAQQETNGCNTNCTSEWNNQICATNDEGKTKLFPSECVMKSENCLNKSSKISCEFWCFFLLFSMNIVQLYDL